jgi:UDP-glucuronate decarboxylase
MQALRGEDITIYGDGTQSRSFCYVDDLIDGLLRLMDSADDFTGPVNMGNPQEIAIGTLAEKILMLTGSRSKLSYKPAVADDPQQRRPDITLAQKNLGWQPHTSLDDGLRETIRYFQRQLA